MTGGEKSHKPDHEGISNNTSKQSFPSVCCGASRTMLSTPNAHMQSPYVEAE